MEFTSNYYLKNIPIPSFTAANFGVRQESHSNHLLITPIQYQIYFSGMHCICPDYYLQLHRTILLRKIKQSTYPSIFS